MLLALSMVMSLGAAALAAEGEDVTLWFMTEDGQTEFASETPATVTMTVTVPQDGTYLVTTLPEGPDGGPEGFSVTSEDEPFAFLAEQELRDLWNGGHWPVELTAGDYAVTAENVTSMSMSLFLVDDTGMPDDIPSAAERVDASFRVSDGDRSSTYFYTEEPSSVTMTATVEQDGLYLVDLFASGDGSLSLTVDGDALAFMNQLPLEDVGFGEYGVEKIALVELTAGEYTLQIENGISCSAYVELTHPLDAVDGVIGEGLYVCQLDEAVTVNYTVMGAGAEADFYTGPADSLSKAGHAWAYEKNSDQAVVSFEPGTAVIDFEGGYVTSALVGSTGDVPAEPEPTAAEPEVPDAGSEPVVFDGFEFVRDGENMTFQDTATVPADGYYLFYAMEAEDAPVSFATDLPIQTEPGAVPDWTYTDGYGIGVYELAAAVELTAGDYSVTVGSTDYYSDCIAMLTPAQMVDSLAGTFAQGGVYMCVLPEPVTFTMGTGGTGGIAFYSGEEGAFLQALTPEIGGGRLMVEFPAGLAVIDASEYESSINGNVN